MPFSSCGEALGSHGGEAPHREAAVPEEAPQETEGAQEAEAQFFASVPNRERLPNPRGAGEIFIRQLIDDEPASDALEKLILYVAANLDRIGFSTYRAHGSQIGSGAMESLHRTASQMRLKLAGARWTAEKAIAVLNLRLMTLAERWSDFWNQEAPHEHPVRRVPRASGRPVNTGLTGPQITSA